MSKGSNDVEVTGAWTADGNWIVAPAEIDGTMSIYAFSTDGAGIMVRLDTQTGADPSYVGSVGEVVINTVYVPLAIKE